jgi:hypothetical protein
MKKMKKSVAGITAISAAWLAAAAVAAPQESVTFNSVESNGSANNAANQIRTHTFVGGYAPKSIRVTGELLQVNSATWASEAQVMVTPPGGTSFEMQVSLRGQTWTGANVVDVTLPIPASSLVADAAGEWTFRFYESTDDGGTTSVDAIWDTITFTLDDELVVLGTPATDLGGGVFEEVEPNDASFLNMQHASAPLATQYGAANLVTLGVGNSITGTTTGSSTTTLPGTGATIDNFLIQTVPDVPGIYLYELGLTSAITGHTASLRGATQSSNLGAGFPGVIRIGSDSTFQTSTNVGTTRVNRWYGFGKGEMVHYRVTGTASTTDPYVATLNRTPISPVVVPNTVAAGSVSFSRGAGNTNTIDVLLLDSDFNTVASWHGMTTGAMNRTLTDGTYYLAVSNATTTDSTASPADSSTRANGVANLPGFVMNSSTTTVSNLSMNIIDGMGTQTVAGMKSNAFEVQFYQFTVQTMSIPPMGVGAATPSTVIEGGTSLLTVSVTPGTNPVSTDIAVVADLSSIGGSSNQAFFDDGTNGDAVAGDNIFSFTVTTPLGANSYTLPFEVSDAQSRVSNGTISLTTFGPPPSTDLGALPIGQTEVTHDPVAGQVKWYKFTVPEISPANTNWLDIWTSGGVSDTEIGLYRADGTLVASDDDDGPSTLSALSFGMASPIRPLPGGVDHNGRDGTLEAGDYYLAVGPFNVTFNPTAFNVTSTGGSGTNLVLFLFLGPAPTNPSVTGGIANSIAGGTALLTATVTPGLAPNSTGLAVNADLTNLGGSATNAMYDDGTNGDAVAGDNVFSLIVPIPASLPGGNYTVPLTVTDDQSRSGSGSGTIQVDDAGETLATAKPIDGVGPVTSISGILTSNDADLFRIYICDPANFSASTVGGTTLDSQLFLFAADGTGVVMNDDEGVTNGASQSTITSEHVASRPAGEYYLAITAYNKDPLDSSNAAIFPNSSTTSCFGSTFRCQMLPLSPTAVLDHWASTTTSSGDYTIFLTGVSGQPCGPVCGTADFDGDGDIGTDADIEAFFACLAGNCCDTCFSGGADFDGDGDIGTDADIESFFRVLAGGNC